MINGMWGRGEVNEATKGFNTSNAFLDHTSRNKHETCAVEAPVLNWYARIVYTSKYVVCIYYCAVCGRIFEKPANVWRSPTSYFSINNKNGCRITAKIARAYAVLVMLYYRVMNVWRVFLHILSVITAKTGDNSKTSLLGSKYFFSMKCDDADI